MNGIDALVDALFVAIEAKKAGQAQEVIAANRRVEDAFLSAVKGAMSKVFKEESQRPSAAFHDAVRKAINPTQLFS